MRFKLTSPGVEIYAKCYGYGSTSWLSTIIILAIIVGISILISIYCFYLRKTAKVKPNSKIKNVQRLKQRPSEHTFIRQ